ncbi:MAG: hypothetical protein IDH49_05395, partial [Gammaproteobacteria bacterium]|nr:hypothetical protein [Gammaproteobacteria bacterium]
PPKSEVKGRKTKKFTVQNTFFMPTNRFDQRIGVKNEDCSEVPKANQDEHVHRLGYTECDYLELGDWAGRAVRSDKRGAIPGHIPPILDRLGLDPGRYLHYMRGNSKLTHHLTAIGPLDQLQALAKKMGQSFLKGNGLARQLYCSSV